jgi:acetylornithine deacetylase/succinyl-diaminopimelate desuccinylase-like protein
MRRHGLPAAVLLASLAITSGRSELRPLRGGEQSAVHPTAQLLSDLIRIDTSNPPGHEQRIADFLAPRFAALGFQTRIVPTPEAGKAALFARLKGDGSQKPILLAAHADVVGVEREKWTVDPFAGIIRDGTVIGRGAIDFKGGMAVFARAVMMLAENRVPLSRDVIFLTEPDEEAAQYNTTWLAQNNWAAMDCEFALNEGGWIIKSDDGRVRYVSISTNDKSTVLVQLTARGTSTHASMPRPDSAIFRLSKVLSKLSEFETPLDLTPSTRRFLHTLARISTAPMSEHFETLASGKDAAALTRADAEVSKDPLLHAIMRTTFAPVLLNAGIRSNVIPGSAQATLNVRIIPGTDVNAILATFERVIGDPLVTAAFANPSAAAAAGRGAPSSEDTDLFRALERQARATFPGAEVTPYLFQAGTDAGAWRSRGVPVYGIYPYPITADELTRMHGNDEQVSVESLRAGTEMIYKTLVEVAGKR